MNELVLALLFIFPPTTVLLFYLIRFLVTQKSRTILINEKIAPFLFPLYLFLTASFRLGPVRNFLQWFGISQELVGAILIFAVIDNIFLFFLKEQRIRKVLKAYAKYLKGDTREFVLVLILAFLCGLVVFFKARTLSSFPVFWSTGVFFGVLFFLPLVLYHYHDLQVELKFKIKPELFINLIKLLFFIICPFLFIRLFKLLLSEATTIDMIVTTAGWILELTILYLFWKKIIKIPKLITESAFFLKTETLISILIKQSLRFLYGHIEILAVLFLLLIVSWPFAMSRIDEYRNWRSNFPVIKKALPIIGMQGTAVILYGDNFGTTGLGVPGTVMVENRALLTAEWNDHKIVAVVPVGKLKGQLYIRKKFMWDGKNYVTDSNKVKFEYFDWQKTNQQDIANFLDMLVQQYREKE